MVSGCLPSVGHILSKNRICTICSIILSALTSRFRKKWKKSERVKCCNFHDVSLIPGHNPSFDESFQFQVSVPELALVRFLVLDDDFIGMSYQGVLKNSKIPIGCYYFDFKISNQPSGLLGDDFIGQYTVPFECLQPGREVFCLLVSNISIPKLKNVNIFALQL